MPKIFKVLSGDEVVKILITFGFILKTQKGSHIKLVYMGINKNIVSVVPNHKQLKQGTMISIYKQLLEIDNIDTESLNKFFKN